MTPSTVPGASRYRRARKNARTSSRAAIVGTGTRLPAIRADWFTATASRAPLYYDVLQIPQNLPELERQLRIDAQANIQQGRAMRVGFNGSGVSRFNRILERHDSVHGAYWRSYDFDEPPANLIDRASGAATLWVRSGAVTAMNQVNVATPKPAVEAGGA